MSLLLPSILLGLAQAATPEEEALQDLLDAGKLISARSAAEAVLEEAPDSVLGNYAMGKVLWQSEGDLARARRHYLAAEQAFRDGDWPEGEGPWLVHAYTTVDLAWLHLEMADYRQQLEWLDAHDALYDPDMIAERAWPMMMLGREGSARDYAQQGISSEGVWQQSMGWNALCAIEAKSDDRQAAYEACMGSLEHERAMPNPDPVVDAGNAANAAYSLLRFEEVEALIRESATGSTEEVTNPYITLVGWMLLQGRGEEAVEAMWSMKRWTQAQPPSMRIQARAEADASLAIVLLVAGEAERGMDVIDRAVRFPDRGGLSSGSRARTEAGHRLLRIQLRQLLRQREAERASAGPWWRRTWHKLRAWLPDLADRKDRVVVRAALMEGNTLTRSLRPYLDGGLSQITPWMSGALIDVVGAGVVNEGLVSARRVERYQTLEELQPALEAYAQALEAEASGDEAEALALAEAALEGLPEAEVLLRARVAVIAGDAAWSVGEEARALALLEQAMQEDPGALRRLGRSLPARVEAPPSPLGQAVAEALLRSPRLTPSPQGFSVSVEGVERPRVCLRGPKGALLSCTDPVPAPESGGVEAHVVALCEAFHQRAFGLPLGLSSVDLNSLDGQTVVAHEARREAVERLLEGL